MAGWLSQLDQMAQSFAGPAHFQQDYYCYPVSFAGKEALEKGNKILLPHSALTHLARLNVTWPMIFECSNKRVGLKTHCGVLEFVAEEGMCYMPYWMMQNIGLKEAEIVQIRNVSLPKGTFVKLQPLTSDFLSLSNPRAVLENLLRHFATFTLGDTISLQYGDKTFRIEIVELKPGNAVSVIETDMQVDFAPPKDYVEPPPKPKVAPTPPKTEPASSPSESPAGAVFAGKGSRLDGRKAKPPTAVSPSASEKVAPPKVLPEGVRTWDEEYAKLVRAGRVPGVLGDSVEEKRDALFLGQGRTLG